MHTATVEFPLELSESTRESINAGTIKSDVSFVAIESGCAGQNRSPWSIRAGFLVTLLALVALWGSLSLDGMTWHFVHRYQIRPAYDWLRDCGAVLLYVSAGLSTIAAAVSIRFHQLAGNCAAAR